MSQLDDNLVRKIVDELLGRSAFKTSQQQQHTRFQEVEDNNEMEEDQGGGGDDNDDDDDSAHAQTAKAKQQVAYRE